MNMVIFFVSISFNLNQSFKFIFLILRYYDVILNQHEQKKKQAKRYTHFYENGLTDQEF